MKIALFCLGTRGDVQPYAILANRFKAAGHEVVVSTAKNFESLVRGYGVDFIPVEADYQGLLDSEEGKRMMKNPIRARRLLETPSLYTRSMEMMEKIREENGPAEALRIVENT
jgi:sterol 3beta-glucosyltransferase